MTRSNAPTPIAWIQTMGKDWRSTELVNEIETEVIFSVFAPGDFGLGQESTFVRFAFTDTPGQIKTKIFTAVRARVLAVYGFTLNPNTIVMGDFILG